MSVSSTVQQLVKEDEKIERRKSQLLTVLQQLNIATIAGDLTRPDYARSKLSDVGCRIELRSQYVDVIVDFSHSFPVPLIGPSWFIAIQFESVFGEKKLETTCQLSSEAELAANTIVSVTLPVPSDELSTMPWIINAWLLFNPIDLLAESNLEDFEGKIVSKRINCLDNVELTITDLLYSVDQTPLLPALYQPENEENKAKPVIKIDIYNCPKSILTSMPDVAKEDAVKFGSPIGQHLTLSAKSNFNASFDISLASRDCFLLKQTIDAFLIKIITFQNPTTATTTTSVNWWSLIKDTTKHFFPSQPHQYCSNIFQAEENTLQNYANNLFSNL